MIESGRYSPDVDAKIEQHRKFWLGEGPSLLLIPRRALELYDLESYVERFREPARMLEFELERARGIATWPTDGIPTVRPNLGTVLVPASIGQEYQLRIGAMPWPGASLSRAEIRDLDQDLPRAELMRQALEFYRLARSAPDVYAYHADTQGVFDIAHLLYGTSIFTEMLEVESQAWVAELMERCLQWYIQSTNIFKEAIGEPTTEMIHGHGTEQGLFFPTAGCRISEDTATLLSPDMIERELVPFMERSAAPFGGAFVHYCGKHDALFQMLCERPWIRAIDLGNPEMYELDELLRICAETGTVFYSRIAAEPSEGWRDYVRRVGRAVSESGARCAIRPLACPLNDPEAAAEMLGTFHEMTVPG